MVQSSGRSEGIVQPDCVLVKQIPTEKGHISLDREASYHLVPENLVMVVRMASALCVEKAFLAVL